MNGFATESMFVLRRYGISMVAVAVDSNKRASPGERLPASPPDRLLPRVVLAVTSPWSVNFALAGPLFPWVVYVFNYQPIQSTFFAELSGVRQYKPL